MKKLYQLLRVRFCLEVFFLIATSIMLFGQGSSGKDSPNGFVKPLDSSSTRTILATLQNDKADWQPALQSFFGNIYDKNLPDLIVFVSAKKQVVNMQLMKGGKSRRDLFGEQKLYVLLFGDGNFNQGDTSGTYHPTSFSVLENRSASDSVTSRALSYSIDRSNEQFAFVVRRNALNYLEPPASVTIGSILNFIVSYLSGASASITYQQSQIADSSARIKMKCLGRVGSDSLFFAEAKFSLGTNTNNRIVVVPAKESWFSDANFNFENADESRLGSSLAIAFSTIGEPGIYLLAHVYISRPMKPLNSDCWGLAFGTNLSDKSSIASNWFVGMRASLDYLFVELIGFEAPVLGETGALLGMNVRDQNSRRTVGFSFGFDFKF